MIIYISTFVKENSNVTTIVVAFYMYLGSLILFTIIFLIKWIHFWCGSGKGNYDPWNVKPVREGSFLSPEQRTAILSMTNDYLKQQGKGNLQLQSGVPTGLDA